MGYAKRVELPSLCQENLFKFLYKESVLAILNDNSKKVIEAIM